jgi:hypothetical protein
MAAYQPTKPYDSGIQVQAMKARYPSFKAKRKSDGSIVFTGQLQVKPELPVYTVQVVYNGNAMPFVYILDPLPVVGAPHIYSNTKSLCLYHKDNYRWHKEKLIATDIMGWTAGWIYFYEYWLQSGDWIGPEVPHNI